MSVREVVARLEAAKGQLIHVKAAGDQSAQAIAEAARLVDAVLEGVRDAGLGSAITAKATQVADDFNSVMGLSREIDSTVQRVRAIGSAR